MAEQTTVTDPWLQRARDAYDASTNYFDSNIRKQIEADIRQATGRHPTGSKYYSEAYKSRSKLFRPKTGAAIRKNNATAAAAFFSTQDVVSITTNDDNNVMYRAGAHGMQTLLQYRLTKSIPWFLICVGAYDDAQKVGVVASKQTWEFKPKQGIDRPTIDLIPVENLRFDPGAKWYDPLGTSPYIIHMIPMYIRDVLARMEKGHDGKDAKWKTLSKAQVYASCKNTMDSTRQTREDGRNDSQDNPIAITEFSIVWVNEVIMNIDGEDMIYYTLGREYMLSDPVPLEEVYFHGIRPFALGFADIEPHKIYPTSLPKRTRDVQAEINQIANSRIDNVLFAMNKRYFVKRGQQVDLRSLQRNVPGSATLMVDPNGDVVVVDTKDVTGSAYQEQDRLNLDFDDMAGSFSQSSVQSNKNLNETVGGMEILTSGANQMSEFQLRVFSETWVEKVLYQLVELEKHYESDEDVLRFAAGKLVEKFGDEGIDFLTDEMLMQDFAINVNVGIGATNPQTQVERFIFGMNSLAAILGPSFQQRINVEEVTAELFGKLGYKDGKRFFNWEKDAKYMQLVSTIEELTAKLQAKTDPELVQAQIRKLGAEVENIRSESLKKVVEAVYSSMQAGQAVATMPQIAPIADTILEGAGYVDQGGEDPDIPAPVGINVPPPDVNTNTSPVEPPVPESPMVGIETMRPDGFVAETGAE